MTIHKFHKTNEGVYLSPVYVRDDGKCTCAENVITVTLTQEETLLLNCDCKTEIQIRAKTVDGKALASKIFTVDTERILKDGEI